MIEDPIVCVCGGVTEDTVLAARDRGCIDLDAIRRATGANEGCGDCAPDIEDILAEEA